MVECPIPLAEEKIFSSCVNIGGHFRFVQDSHGTINI